MKTPLGLSLLFVSCAGFQDPPPDRRGPDRLDAESRIAVYHPHAQFTSRAMNVMKLTTC